MRFSQHRHECSHSIGIIVFRDGAAVVISILADFIGETDVLLLDFSQVLASIQYRRNHIVFEVIRSSFLEDVVCRQVA